MKASEQERRGGSAAHGEARGGADGRLVTYEAPGGILVCLAHGLALSSERPVIASLCGDGGCHGMWFCLTGRAA